MGNDRLRFRQWHKKHKEMIPLNLCSVSSLSQQGELVVYMQCTGLKDSGGNLIYEGDILQKGSELYEVEYRFASFTIRTAHYGWHLLSEFKHIKVIGNIYQNPELLNYSHVVGD